MIKLILFIALILQISVEKQIKLPLFKSHKTFNQFLQSKIKNSRILKANANLELTTIEATGFFTKVNIGTPPQQVNLLIDTGSYHFYVASNNLTTGGFSCENSDTCTQLLNQNLSIEFGDGDVNGNYIQDNVIIDSLQIENYTFGMALQTSDDFSFNNFVGGFGLAQCPGDCFETPIMVKMLQLGLIESISFSIYLPMSYNYSGNAIYGGELTIGGVDFSHAATNFSYYPNVGDHLAQINIDSFSVGGKVLEGINQIEVDSGTTFMAVDGSIRSLFLSNFPESFQNNTNIEDCSQVDTFPNIEFQINGTHYILTPYDYVRFLTFGGEQYCSFDIQENTFGFANIVLFGDSFMRKYYTHFDFSNQQIGFAIAKPSQSSSESNSCLSENCLECMSNNQCQLCLNGYELSNGQCIQKNSSTISTNKTNYQNIQEYVSNNCPNCNMTCAYSVDHIYTGCINETDQGWYPGTCISNYQLVDIGNFEFVCNPTPSYSIASQFSTINDYVNANCPFCNTSCVFNEGYQVNGCLSEDQGELGTCNVGYQLVEMSGYGFACQQMDIILFSD